MHFGGQGVSHNNLSSYGECINNVGTIHATK